MSSIAAINKLPNEMLSEIFTDAVCDNNIIKARSKRHFAIPVPQTIVLSSVCTNWREITLSRSQLWSTFEVHDVREQKNYEYSDGSGDERDDEYDEYNDYNERKYVYMSEPTEVVDLFCERSRDEPLHLTLSLPRHRNITSVIKRVLHESHRWKSLDVRHHGAYNEIMDLLHLHIPKLPKLESLVIEEKNKATST